MIDRRAPTSARVDGTIELLDYSGAPIADLPVQAGLADQVHGRDAQRATNDVALEEVTIAHEGVERE